MYVMNGKQLSATTVGFGLSTAIASILSLLLVLVKETQKPVFTVMANLTSHHWITHGLVVVVLFVVLGFLLSKVNGGKGIELKPKALVCLIASAAVLNFVVLSGFYLFMD